FVWEGDPASAAAWKAGGFNPVVLSATDIVSSFQTGMIDAVAYPPAYAMALRVHDKAKYMTDLVLSSFTGALVIDKKAWDKVPPDLQPKLRQVSQDVGKRLIDESRKMESESLAKMKSQGLQVVHVTDVPEWQKMVDDTYKVVRGKVVPEAT